ncbi:MAG: dynamin family protein, partial [Pseudomonadota bacterium]
MRGHPTATGSGISYRRLMYDLVDNLRDLRDMAASAGDEALRAEVEAGLDGLEAHNFRLAVVGEFKRGKSTFINALLGSAVLPADILPTSATLNRITYGLSPSAQLRYHGSDVVEQIPIEALAEHVTKLTPEAEARAARVAEAVVCFPSPFCRNNIDLYDTPGLADEARMTAITLDVLPRVDAVILVVMGDSPFSSSEAEFLDTLLDRGLRRIIVVVTGMDRVRRVADRERLVGAIRERVIARTAAWAEARLASDPEAKRAFLAENAEPALFAISGIEALESKLAGDEEALERSGFPALEAYLERFLTEHADSLSLRRRVTSVQAWCARLALALQARAEDLPRALERTCARHRTLAALIDVVEGMLTRELAALEAGARALVYGPLEPVLTRAYPDDLKQAIQRGIRTVSVTVKALLEPEELRRRIGDAVVLAQEYAAAHYAPRVLEICLPAVRAQRAGLAPMAVAADRLMLHVRHATEDGEPGAPALASALSLREALGCERYAGELLWAEALGGPPRADAGAGSPGQAGESSAGLQAMAPSSEDLQAALSFSRQQLCMGQDSRLVTATAEPPASSGIFGRTTWEVTAPGNYRKASINVAIAALDAALRADPLGERVLRSIQRMQAETVRSLELFLEEIRRERVSLSMREQRQEVMLEREQGDLASLGRRIEAIRAHAAEV